MRTLDVERLATGDYVLVKPLLVELHLSEQVHYADHPQLPREEIDPHPPQIPPPSRAETATTADPAKAARIAGFSWSALSNPGPGPEGEVAEPNWPKGP